jgi:hypothetical protein
MASARILYPTFRDETAAIRYPFSDNATLQANNSDFNIGLDSFIDATLYPIGAGPGLHITRVETTSTQTRIVITDAASTAEFVATYNTLQPPNELIEVLDSYDRPAGYLLSSADKLASFGTQNAVYEFDQEATEFAATVVIPATAPGVRGVKTDSSKLIAKDLWLVGDMGVQLTHQGNGVIRVDVIGEPLFKRALCGGNTAFPAKKYVRTINGCGPDEFGNFIITPTRQLAADSILRVYPSASGIVIEAVGRSPNG